MKRMYFLLAFLAAVQPELSYNEQVGRALADYNRFSASDKPYIRYATLHSVPAEIKAAEVQRFWLPHISTQQVLERIMPVKITGTEFYRFDLRDLHWTLPAWAHVMESYPYDLSGSGNPLFVRMDWLTWITSDGQLNSAYYDLLYGEKRFPDNAVTTIRKPTSQSSGRNDWSHTGGPRRGNERIKPRVPVKPPTTYVPKAQASAGFPATGQEFFKFWAVDTSASREFLRAHIIAETESGVAFEERLAEVYFERVAAWQTFDSESASGDHSPFSDLTKHPKYDAGELIVGMPKISLRTGEQFTCQAYLLTDGNDKRVNEASGRIVTDSSDKIKIIRTPGSCVRCHTTGILQLPRSLVRSIILKGGELTGKSKDQAELIERRILARLDGSFKDHQEDFANYVAAVTELSAAEVVGEYSKLLQYYDAPLTLEQAAVEVYAKDANELKLALGLYAARKGPSPDFDNIMRLTIGEKVSRDAWEGSVFQQASAALSLWRSR